MLLVLSQQPFAEPVSQACEKVLPVGRHEKLCRGKQRWRAERAWQETAFGGCLRSGGRVRGAALSGKGVDALKGC